MEKETKTALLGTHDQIIARNFKWSLKDKVCSLVVVDSIDKMLVSMGITPDSPVDSPPTNLYDIILMEVNLGYPGAPTYDPALKIYQHLKPYVTDGRTQFMSFSGENEAVSGAQQADIPCIYNDQLQSFLDKL